MNCKRMIAVLVLCNSAALLAAPDSPPIGDIRGLAAINNHIKSKVLDPSDFRTHAFGIEWVAGADVYALRTVLGSYSEDLPHHLFNGAEPNPYNVLLWHLIMDRFSDLLSKDCATRSAETFFIELPAADGDTTLFKLNPSTAEALINVCRWPETEEDRFASLNQVWTLMMGYGYDTEREIWADFFVARDVEPERRLKEVIMAITLNPYFLLGN